MLLALLAMLTLTIAQADDRAALKARIAAFDAHARYPLPALSDSDLDRLLSGRVVKIREVSDEGPQRVTGLLLASAPKEKLFVSASDPHLAPVEEVTDVLLATEGTYPKRWYQFLDLPRPFADRHWVVDIRDNVEMHEATAGACWEHWWALADDGPTLARQAVAEGKAPKITPAMAEAAVYVDVNTGAFVYLDAPGGRTLFGFHATSAVGGAVPDGVVARWSMLTVGKLLKTIVERVDEACAHYDAAHEPVLGGHGAPLPPGCG